MPVTTGTFDALKGHNDQLVRKMLELAIFVAPWPTATEVTTVSDATGANLVVPTEYLPVGITNKDQGATWTPKLEMQEVNGYGYGQPIRRDTTARTNDLKFSMIESRRRAWEVYEGIDLSTVATPSGNTKMEIQFDRPDLPPLKYWRVLAVGKDGYGVNAIYHVEFLSKAILTAVDPNNWQDGAATDYGVTLSADFDAAVGTSQRTFWCGPGFTSSLITAMGFTVTP